MTIYPQLTPPLLQEGVSFNKVAQEYSEDKAKGKPFLFTILILLMIS